MSETPTAPAESSTPAGEPMEHLDPVTGDRYDQQGRRLCSAQRSNGRGPCRAPAVTGMKVCRTHGGSSPQARNKARLRLAELVDPAIATLAREMAQADKSADKQRAANSILDRAGVGRAGDSDAETAKELLLERLLELRNDDR